MKKKSKFALEQLEKDLSILPQVELQRIMGGQSSGLNEWSTIGEIVDHFTDMGMEFTQDSQGNYFFGSSGTTGSPIMLDTVDVFASSGSGGSSGSSGSDVEGTFVNYFEQLGFMFDAAGGGGGGGGGNGNNYTYVGYDKQDDDDPWLRDNDGNIVKIIPPLAPDSYTYQVYNDVTLQLEKVILVMADGTEVVAYEVWEVFDSNLMINRAPTVAEKSNCFGRAFADGEYIFWDNTMTGTDEFAGFSAMFGDENSTDSIYVECSKSEATMAIIYDDAGPYHAGLYDPATDTYTAKGGVGEEGSYVGETKFRIPHPEDPDAPRYDVGVIKYYRLR